MRLFYFIILVTLVISCNSFKNKIITNQMLVSYESKSCYGKCAVFKIKINFDKTIEYDGFENVQNIGTFRFKMSDKDFDQIYKRISNLDLKSIDSVYTSKSTDLHLRILNINKNNENKKILLFDNIPVELKDLEYNIHKILNISISKNKT